MADPLRLGSTLRITDKKTMELIELYEAQECLWNTTHKDYRNKPARKMAARNIAQELKVPGFRAHHVIAKFKNIRNAFSQELKKIERSRNSSNPYVPRVFWFEKMNSFILPHLQKPRLSNTVYLNGSEDWVQPTIAKEESRPLPMETEKCVPFNSSRSSSPIGLHKGTKISTDRDLVHTLKEISGNLNSLNAMIVKNDCYESFGKYIADLLRNLPPEKAWELQPRIVSIITRAGLESCGVRANNDDGSKDPGFSEAQIKIEPVEDNS